MLFWPTSDEIYGLRDLWHQIPGKKYSTLKNYKRIAPGLDFKILFSIFTVLEITFAMLPAIIIFSLTWIIYSYYYYRKSYEKWMEFIKEENKGFVFQQKALLILFLVFFIYNIIYLTSI